MPRVELPSHQVTKGSGANRGKLEIALGGETVALAHADAVKLVKVFRHPERFTSHVPSVLDVVQGQDDDAEVRLNGVACGNGTRRQRWPLGRALLWTGLEVEREERGR